ncbi:5-deoxy-glucuronate isomerase [Rubrivivax sp. A210]|nr:5-deoxy-glucuronate isomerase [Rubrivivax sp. A210]
MVSPLLVRARPEGREIVDVTPARAGWTHVGFRALRLRAGESEALATGTRELCLVVLAGTVDVEVDGQRFSGLGTRSSVFEEKSPAARYVPAGRQLKLRARGDAELALCTAPADGQRREVRLIDPATLRRSVLGQGTNTRYVCDILPHDDPTAAHLLVVEVLTQASHSSSYPPHKHDVESPPNETLLEETYLLPPPEAAAGLCLPARLHRRPQPRRGLRGGGP